MRHYFDSIDHTVLKNIIRTLIKNIKTLAVLDELIDSFHTEQGKGVPIGNLTSQFFANLYLAGMDHFIIDRLRPAAYYRYMDDFALWGDSPDALKQWLHVARTYTASLALTVKPPILGRTADGLPFLGFLIKDRGIFLLRKSRERARERMTQINTDLASGSISEGKAAERALSVFCGEQTCAARAVSHGGLASCFRASPLDSISISL
jgi:hypothetical protein